MKGKVALLNIKRGMAALITESEDFTTFELHGNEVEIGDIISGDLESLGGATWYNETKMENIDVFVEDILGSKATALKIIS